MLGTAAVAHPPRCGAQAARSARPASHHRPRPSQPQPFDPDELARRLCLLLAEQKTQAERKRHGLAGAASNIAPVRPGPGADSERGSPPPRNDEQGNGHAPPGPSKQKRQGPWTREEPYRIKLHLTTSATAGPPPDEPVHSSAYRHIPQEAASQFARTTTAERPARRLVHSLSRKAIKFHFDGPNAVRDMAAAKPDTATVQLLCRRPSERSPAQHAPALATAAEADEQRSTFPHRHAFESHPTARGGRAPDKQTLGRRRSTGGILARSGLLHAGPFDTSLDRSFGLASVDEQPRHDVLDPSDHLPVDWTQSDESCVQSTMSTASSYLFRRHELRWPLRGRLRSFTARRKNQESTSPARGKRASQTSSKPLKAGIFARFRR